MEYLIGLVVFGYVMWRTGKGSVKRQDSPIEITRSQIPQPPQETFTCGNCRGIGQDGFGLMPDSFECEGCNGRGYVRLDPNAISMTLAEFYKKYKPE